LPETVAVPTVVPPLVHVLRAVDWGPNTVYVIIPPAAGLLVPPERVALTELAAIAVAAVPLTGPAAVEAVVFFTAVEVMLPLLQVLPDPLLLLSPL
jgi:hypothetical protein